MNLQTFLTVLTAVSTACAIFFGVKAYARNRDSDTKEDAKNDATLLTEIGYIKANTDEIKAEQKEQRKTNIEFVQRLSAVEKSVEQAHNRIDELKSSLHE